MNSFRNVQKAIDFEVKRQAEILESGGRIHQETRNYDAGKNITFALRSKEEAHDYRYFPEPDLQPVRVNQGKIEKAKNAMPALPWERLKKYMNDYGLSRYDAEVLTEDREMSDFFEEVLGLYPQAKSVANVLNTQVRAHLNQRSIELTDYPVSAEQLADLLTSIDKGEISHSVAMQKVLPILEKGTESKVLDVAEENGWIMDSDEGQLETWIAEALAKFPDKVSEYKAGKKGLLGHFIGEVMKASKG
jgi:aspartyl-tRNA(Asn)/glutamyl-tRNA(Gln) amidotransferase subunit B